MRYAAITERLRTLGGDKWAVHNAARARRDFNKETERSPARQRFQTQSARPCEQINHARIFDFRNLWMVGQNVEHRLAHPISRWPCVIAFWRLNWSRLELSGNNSHDSLTFLFDVWGWAGIAISQ